MAGQHDHDHSHHHHHHGHGDTSLPVMEEPLDPAQQSLSDALRVSFSALKFVMLVLVILFLINGIVFNVDEKEVVVLLRFGQPVGEPLRSGLHFSWPYPIEKRVPVSMVQRSLSIDEFWMRLSERERAMGDLPSRTGGLDPESEGALLTGDRALMHLLFTAQYRVRDDATGPRSFVKNVPVDEESNERDPEVLLRPILRSAAVAEATRSTADQILTDASTLVDRIRRRAQSELDALQTGIDIVTITADKSYYPLQVKSEFIDVSAAESRRTQLIQEANKEREETLQEAAGAAWRLLAEEIEKLNQAENEAELQAVITRILDIIEKEATGKAGRMIQNARRDRESIVEETLARVQQFERLLDAYRDNPELVRTTLQKDMLQKLWDEPGVNRYLMPEGEQLPVFWINKDPVELRKAEEEAIKKRSERR